MIEKLEDAKEHHRPWYEVARIYMNGRSFVRRDSEGFADLKASGEFRRAAQDATNHRPDVFWAMTRTLVRVDAIAGPGADVLLTADYGSVDIAARLGWQRNDGRAGPLRLAKEGKVTLGQLGRQLAEAPRPVAEIRGAFASPHAHWKGAEGHPMRQLFDGLHAMLAAGQVPTDRDTDPLTLMVRSAGYEDAERDVAADGIEASRNFPIEDGRMFGSLDQSQRLLAGAGGQDHEGCASGLVDGLREVYRRGREERFAAEPEMAPSL